MTGKICTETEHDPLQYTRPPIGYILGHDNIRTNEILYETLKRNLRLYRGRNLSVKGLPLCSGSIQANIVVACFQQTTSASSLLTLFAIRFGHSIKRQPAYKSKTHTRSPGTESVRISSMSFTRSKAQICEAQWTTHVDHAKPN
jgi:hypothetical protein